MADETAKPVKPAEVPTVSLGFDLKPQEVTREGAVGKFKVDKIKKGRSKNKGQPFLNPEITSENLQTWITWLGNDNAAAILNSRMRPLSQGWLNEAIEEAKDSNGQVDENKVVLNFEQFAQEFSARGETIKELQSRIMDIIEEMSDVDENSDNPEDARKIMESFKEMRRLKTAISRKKRVDDTEEEETSAVTTK